MRNCIRCQVEMIEECDLKVEGAGYGLIVANNTNKIFADRIGKPSIAICPECGEISIYLENTDKLKKK
ncbi:MAG: nucleic acid-binding protein [bacterium]